MKKLFITTLLVGSAAAFTPAQTGKNAPSFNMVINNGELELGANDEFGVFDPLGWLDSPPETFEDCRKQERVAMAAFTGCIVHNNGIVLSPFNDLEHSRVPADGVEGLPSAGLLQVLFFIALVELIWMPASMYDVEYGVRWFEP